MAGYQPARSAVGESVAEFMERRRREVAQLGHDAEAAGRDAWAAATRAGENLVAARPRDVLALGARVRAGQARPAAVASRPMAASKPTIPPRPQPVTIFNLPAARHSSGVLEYVSLRANLPSDQELADLRRQQAKFGETTRQIDIQNSWLAAPVLAAPLAVMALEGLGALTAGAVGVEAKQAAKHFVEREPHLRVGDNWSTRAGRRAHNSLETKLDAKKGWEYEPGLSRPGQRPLKPDAGTPPRNPLDPDKRYYLELKPNTPSGRAAAARAVKRYRGATEQKVRPIYYNPKDFM
jgi:hypothetical protein